jgi:hypothetical protein
MRAVCFQFMAQFMVVKNFAIEDNNHIAVWADQRLVAAFQVENAQARCAQGNKVGGESALMVGSAVRKGIKRRVEYAARQTFVNVRIPEDATHVSVIFFGQ